MAAEKHHPPVLSAGERTVIEGLPSRRVRYVPARTDVIRQGENPRVVNLIVDGWGCRYKQLSDGRRQILSLFLPGDICDANVYMLEVMDHSVGALTDAKIAEVSPQEFGEAIGGDGRLARLLWFNDLRTMAIQREWTTNIGQRTARERIAHLFCETYHRLRLIGRADINTCAFPLTQNDLADATGLTPVHVNRMVQELRRDGLIELAQRRLRIIDLPALEAEAFFDPIYLHVGSGMGASA
jgi:CRP-like cAMP-binding protein